MASANDVIITSHNETLTLEDFHFHKSAKEEK